MSQSNIKACDIARGVATLREGQFWKDRYRARSVYVGTVKRSITGSNYEHIHRARKRRKYRGAESGGYTPESILGSGAP